MAAEERPWMWVVYILTVGLPVVLLVLFCWPQVRECTLLYGRLNAAEFFLLSQLIIGHCVVHVMGLGSFRSREQDR